ncbi:type I secretion protein TolC, partial [Microbacterium sp. SUBG005]
MDNGYSHDGDDNGFTPLAGAFSFRKCFTTSAKSQARYARKNAGVAQQQANVLVSIDTIAHDTAIAMVQVQTWQQMVKTAKEQLDA